MSSCKDMLSVLASYKNGTQTGAPYAPELCDLGLLMCLPTGEYVCTTLGYDRLRAREMKPSDLYVLCHLHYYNRVPEEECKEQVARLQVFCLVDKQEKITELGLDHIKKGLVL